MSEANPAAPAAIFDLDAIPDPLFRFKVGGKEYSVPPFDTAVKLEKAQRATSTGGEADADAAVARVVAIRAAFDIPESVSPEKVSMLVRAFDEYYAREIEPEKKEDEPTESSSSTSAD